ncbi:MAG: type II secretion system minor pseudopilin GspJ [Gammaproteobacteria bacterium]|nr:type II secretion system minor pseudopilin GspJ [Gammaproteobacteria bacterium]NND54384.1 type II secretion system minor pseudopilin GspJ [Gammaproteobacteria bacterium]
MSDIRIQRGFTLIELLIAMAIFVILAAAMYGGVQWFIAEREIVTERAGQLKDLQRAVRRLQSDFSQAYPRSTRDELGDRDFALRTERNNGITVRFVRSGWRNPAGRNRADLQRLQYRYDEDDEILYLETWPVLNPLLGDEPEEQELLTGVTDFDVEFLDDAGNWVQDWPPAGTTGFTVMPHALRYRITTTVFGEIVRIVEIPG